MGKGKSKTEDEGQSEPSEVETVRAELARVRARFGLDPAIPSILFAGAWIAPSGAIEEDEAEFVDAVADCLSAGLPLDAAVASWASGRLESSPDDDGDDDSVEPGSATARPAAAPNASGFR